MKYPVYVNILFFYKGFIRSAMLKQKTIEKKESKEPQCVHYWIIDFPDGPVSSGKCKRCGMVKNFYNCLDNTELDQGDLFKVYSNN